MNINSLACIGLSGYARSGKDTVVNYLEMKYAYKRIAFADQIRNALYNLNPIIRISTEDDPNATLPWSLSHMVDLYGWEELKEISVDVRGLMQRMGTEVARDMWGDDFWVDQAFKQVAITPRAALSDVRYVNEAQRVRDFGGQVWRIVRPGYEGVNDHASEHALDGFMYDHVILNNGSVEDLYDQIDKIFEDDDLTGEFRSI
jgi:hypothetical protein